MLSDGVGIEIHLGIRNAQSLRLLRASSLILALHRAQIIRVPPQLVTLHIVLGILVVFLRLILVVILMQRERVRARPMLGETRRRIPLPSLPARLRRQQLEREGLGKGQRANDRDGAAAAARLGRRAAGRGQAGVAARLHGRSHQSEAPLVGS